MKEKQGNIPAETSGNGRGDYAKTAHTYCACENIKPSPSFIKQDVYEHLSPFSKRGADFLIEQGYLKLIPEDSEVST